MGGKEGSRGYVYQGIIAVLESLTQKLWDKIYIEFPTEGDKVDIALSNGDTIIRTIQVKSTDNTFSLGAIKQWILDLCADYPCTNYELVLIGQCSGPTISFINSIRKYKLNQLDKSAKTALLGFDTTLLDTADVDVRVLPNDLLTLQSNARDSLAKYSEERSLPLTHSQTDFIVKAMLTDQLLQSTQGGYIDRDTFDSDFNKRICLIKQRYDLTRTPIYIQSFSRGAETIPQEATHLTLVHFFEGRSIKPEVDWSKDILPTIDNFLTSTTTQEKAYKIHLDTHSSIAFACGRILDTKSGICIAPVQKTAIHGHQLWSVNDQDAHEYVPWKGDDTQVSLDCFDTALIINVTHNIESDVTRFMAEEHLPIGRIISCSLPTNGATNFSIQNGTHASLLVNSVYEHLAQRSTAERRATLHIFSSAPNAFMFLLGQVSRGFGKCQLYEYDFEQCGNCSYMPSIHFL